MVRKATAGCYRVKYEALYLQSLEYYLDEGFTYIEAGDGDELWRDYDF
jgi:hypothetical protein